MQTLEYAREKNCREQLRCCSPGGAATAATVERIGHQSAAGTRGQWSAISSVIRWDAGGRSWTGVSPHNRGATHTRLAWSVYTHRPLEPSPLPAAGEDTPAGGGDAVVTLQQ